MAKNNTSISTSSSSSHGHRCNDGLEWIDRITSRLEKPILIDTRKIRPYIFKVPNNVSDLIPQAYAPRKIGLGPYHHFREDLYYRMEQEKLDAVTRLLSPVNQVLNSQHHLILKLTQYARYRSPCILRGMLLGSERAKQAIEIIGVVAGGFGLGQIGKVLKLITSMPWDAILGLFRKVNKSDGNKSKEANKINIPSVLKLCEVGRVKFDLTTWRHIGSDHMDGFIKDISFNEMELIFQLPHITLNATDSEVILRNLVAHEEIIQDENRRPIRIADYVDLMCGIIHTTKDVSLLRKKNIIDGTLGDDKIVGLFDGISKSIGMTDDRESYLKDMIDAVNKYYDNRPRIKARRYTKNCLYTSWKLVLFVISLVTVLRLILKAFCGVYDCSKYFHLKQLSRTYISTTSLAY